jgi:hypothetical protein
VSGTLDGFAGPEGIQMPQPLDDGPFFHGSDAPLRVIEEITSFRLTPEQLQLWRERLSAIVTGERGEIIN